MSDCRSVDCTTIILRQPWEELLPEHKHHVIHTNAIMSVPQRLSVSAQLTNCNVGPCWHVMALAHVGTIGSVVLSSSFITRLPLGGPWANLVTLLVQPQKHIGVRCLPSLPLPVSAGRLS